MQTAQKFWDRATKEQRRWILMICEISLYWIVNYDWAELEDYTKKKIESFYESNWEE